jgi:hypothetical protein
VAGYGRIWKIMAVSLGYGRFWKRMRYCTLVEGIW